MQRQPACATVAAATSRWRRVPLAFEADTVTAIAGLGSVPLLVDLPTATLVNGAAAAAGLAIDAQRDPRNGLRFNAVRAGYQAGLS